MRARTLVSVSAAAAGVGAGAATLTSRRRTGVRPLVAVHLPGEPAAVTSADGTRLAARVLRPAAPRAAVVLAHGWTMDSRFWHHQLLRLLAADHLVVVYDQRGHGGSQRAATGDYGPTVLAIDLDTVVAELVPPDLPLAVVGHSLGAMSIVAWATHPAARARDRLCAAVLCNTGVHQLVPSMASLLPARLPGSVVTQLLTSPVPLPRQGLPFLREAVRYVAHGPDASPAAVALTETMFLDCPADVRAGVGATLARLDLRAAVPRLTVPTLVVGGVHDRMTPLAHARGLAATLPDAELVELPRAGHQAPLECPGETTDLILRHLDATCASV